MIIKTRNSYIEYGHHGMHALLRMSCIVMFPPTEIPKEIDTSHRSSSQKGWAEAEREERLCLCRTEARSQGKFSGCVAQIQAANNAHAEGRPTAAAHIGKGFGTDTIRYSSEVRRRKYVLKYPN